MKTAIQLEMNCYNDKLGVWEPLIEPVADGNYGHRPWTAVVKVSTVYCSSQGNTDWLSIRWTTVVKVSTMFCCSQGNTNWLSMWQTAVVNVR